MTELARHLDENDLKMFDNPDFQRAFKNPAQGVSSFCSPSASLRHISDTG